MRRRFEGCSGNGDNCFGAVLCALQEREVEWEWGMGTAQAAHPRNRLCGGRCWCLDGLRKRRRSCGALCFCCLRRLQWAPVSYLRRSCALLSYVSYLQIYNHIIQPLQATEKASFVAPRMRMHEGRSQEKTPLADRDRQCGRARHRGGRGGASSPVFAARPP